MLSASGDFLPGPGGLTMPAALLQEKVDLGFQVRQVLYIDDEPSVAAIVRYSLELFAGWYAATTDKRYALETAANSPWDAILLEIGLDHGAGFALYEQLTADPRTKDIPLVLVTSRVMGVDYQRYSQMAIAGVIAKPFDPLTLGSKVADLLGWADPCQGYRFS
jgi:CheY-like chemotaxis protein